MPKLSDAIHGVIIFINEVPSVNVVGIPVLVIIVDEIVGIYRDLADVARGADASQTRYAGVRG